jgi:hypothetical protein
MEQEIQPETKEDVDGKGTGHNGIQMVPNSRQGRTLGADLDGEAEKWFLPRSRQLPSLGDVSSPPGSHWVWGSPKRSWVKKPWTFADGAFPCPKRTIYLRDWVLEPRRWLP